MGVPRPITDSRVLSQQLCSKNTSTTRAKRQTAQLRVGSLPGGAPELGCDGEQLVTAATTVCSADDVSATEPQSHRAVTLQQTLSNEVCVDTACV